MNIDKKQFYDMIREEILDGDDAQNNELQEAIRLLRKALVILAVVHPSSALKLGPLIHELDNAPQTPREAEELEFENGDSE
tara:strand:- start:1064 stop:1306 length:243 start_codon:yes stop_codon:yes gene_type:complete